MNSTEWAADDWPSWWPPWPYWSGPCHPAALQYATSGVGLLRTRTPPVRPGPVRGGQRELNAGSVGPGGEARANAGNPPDVLGRQRPGPSPAPCRPGPAGGPPALDVVQGALRTWHRNPPHLDADGRRSRRRWAADLARRLGTLPGPVWVAVHHEPDDDPGTCRTGSGCSSVSHPSSAPAQRGLHRDPDGLPPVPGSEPGSRPVHGCAVARIRRMSTSPDSTPTTCTEPINSSGKRITFTELNAYYTKIAAWSASVGGAPWAIAETGLTDLAAERTRLGSPAPMTTCGPRAASP